MSVVQGMLGCMAASPERQRRRRAKVHPRHAELIARLLPPIYKPFLQSPPPDLTHQQLRTLCSLDAIEPVCVTALAERMGIKKSATSIMVSRLVRRGFAWKVRADEDRRIVLVRLTPAGERVKEAPSAVDIERVQKMLDQNGFDWVPPFTNMLRRAVSHVIHGDKSSGAYMGVGQIASPRPFRSPEMPRAPC